MFRFLREVWIQHGLLWGDPLIGVHHKEPGQLGSEEKGEEVTQCWNEKWWAVILGVLLYCLALWQSLSATGSILASSKCYTTLAVGTLPFWSTANCKGICWWGKYKKTNVQKLYMVTLRNHSAVIYFSHKNLKHKFCNLQYGTVPVHGLKHLNYMHWNCCQLTNWNALVSAFTLCLSMYLCKLHPE